MREVAHVQVLTFDTNTLIAEGMEDVAQTSLHLTNLERPPLSLRFDLVEPWERQTELRKVVTGFTKAPAVKVNGAAATNEFHTAPGHLILKLASESRVEIDW